MQYSLAIDLGASGGRHILGWVRDGVIRTEEIYRFENIPRQQGGALCWDTAALFEHILQGMTLCGERGTPPQTLGIDTWGVDFALLDPADALLDQTVAYRDSRTEGMDQVVERQMPMEILYAKTGIQKQPFNTLYQLAALKNLSPRLLEQAASLLLLPDYFNFLLTGVKKSEYTIATTTGLVNAADKTWDPDILRALGLPARLFGPLSPPGEAVGPLRDALRKRVGYDCTVVLPCSHDTASAFVAAPLRDDDAVTLSSGTWSLLGVETPTPILSPESLRGNFTNEGGYQGRYRYLKNIMGLWMIQSLRRELGGPAFPALTEMARSAEGFPSRVDVDSHDFFAPEHMGRAVEAFCARTGQPVPATPGETLQCVYRSLAAGYGEAVAVLSRLTGRRYTSLNIIGGGSRDGYLNRLTAEATGLEVFAGPSEGTALGNLIVQALAAGTFPSLAAAREAVRKSFEITAF